MLAGWGGGGNILRRGPESTGGGGGGGGGSVGSNVSKQALDFSGKKSSSFTSCLIMTSESIGTG